MNIRIPAGHDRVVARLGDAVERNRLAHALLFTGPEGIGKSLMAHWLATRLLCESGNTPPCGQCRACIQVQANTHPDLMYLVRPPDRKGLGIDAVRSLKRFFQLHAARGGRKIAIVDDADVLSVAAQNALLKTLEEPPGLALIILVAAATESLLPTVRSRCQPVRFRPLTHGQVAALLTATGTFSAEQAAALAEASEGSPGRALRMAPAFEDGTWARLREMLAALDGARYGSVMRVATALGRSEEEMRNRLELLLAVCRDEAREAVSLGAGGHLAAEEAARRAAVLAIGLDLLRDRNPNRPLLAEALALRLARI